MKISNKLKAQTAKKHQNHPRVSSQNIKYKYNFSEYLEESKNTHMMHAENSVLYRGVQGTKRALEALEDLYSMVAGSGLSDSRMVTQKWDGCVGPDSMVITPDGEMTIEEYIANPKSGILGRNIEKGIDEFTDGNLGTISNGTKQWLELTLENGENIQLTEDHEVYLTNGTWVAAIELKEGDDIFEIQVPNYATN